MERFKTVRKSWQDDFDKSMSEFYQKMLANQIASTLHPDARACLIDWAQNYMWPFTIRAIHNLEKTIYALASIEQPFERPVNFA